MMENLIQQLILLLPEGNSYYLIIFLVAFAESLPFAGLIMPGSTIIVVAGFLVVSGKGNLSLIMVMATLGALLGDLLGLWLGKRYGGIILQMRMLKRHRKLVNYAQKFFVSHGGKSLFFSRFLGPIRGIVPFVAGLSKIPARLACLYIFISAILWGISYPLIGYLGGSSLQHAQTLGAQFGLAVFVLLLMVIVHYQVKKLFK